MCKCVCVCVCVCACVCMRFGVKIRQILREEEIGAIAAVRVSTALHQYVAMGWVQIVRNISTN